MPEAAGLKQAAGDVFQDPARRPGPSLPDGKTEMAGRDGLGRAVGRAGLVEVGEASAQGVGEGVQFGWAGRTPWLIASSALRLEYPRRSVVSVHNLSFARRQRAGGALSAHDAVLLAHGVAVP